MNNHNLDSIDPKVIGQNLSMARRARKITQDEAAIALGVSRTTVTAIEQGSRRIRPSELAILTSLYGRRISDVVRSNPPGQEANFLVQFRSSKGALDSTTGVGIEADIMQFEDYCRWYVELEELLDSPLPHRYPQIYDISSTPPDRAAEEVASSERNRLGLGDGPIGNIWDILESEIGLRIFSIPMANRHISGMFVYSENYLGCVAVNSNHIEERQRWSATHEYGHFLSSRFRPEVTVFRSGGRLSQNERFADSFARFFLMPATGLTRSFETIRRSKSTPVTPADVVVLSNTFKVSVQAMILRLEDLRLLPAGTWDKLIEVGFKPDKMRDYVGLNKLERERSLFPLRYEMLAAQAFSDGLISEGQLARRLESDRGTASARAWELMETSVDQDDGQTTQLTLDFTAALS